ncbi:MAG: response regulator transcription factor [bacterium]
MFSVLIVEDNPSIRALVAFALEQEGYIVYEASTGKEGKKTALEKRPDIVLLDYYLPDTDGFSVGRFIRNSSETKNAVIFMLSDRKDEDTIVSGIKTFADDYITKPFGPKVLIAKIALALTKKRNGYNNEINVCDITLLYESMELRINNEPVSIKRTEFKLLKILAENLNRIFTREELLREIHGNHTYVSSRTIDNHISRLRKILKKSELSIETVRQEGYRLFFNYS